METIADRIKQLRTKHLHCTQKQFGQWCGGVSKSAVSQWERSITEPDSDNLRSLQRKKGVSPAWVRDGTGAIFIPAQHELSPQQEGLLDLFAYLDETQRHETIEKLTEMKRRNLEIFAALKSRETPAKETE